MVHFARYTTPCAQNQHVTRHHLMPLLMALAANYVNRYAHQMGLSLVCGCLKIMSELPFLKQARQNHRFRNYLVQACGKAFFPSFRHSTP